MLEWQAWKDAPQHKADCPGPGMTRKTRKSTGELAEKAIDGASREAHSLHFSANSALSAVDLPYRRSSISPASRECSTPPLNPP
jgi:hypothetical protein